MKLNNILINLFLDVKRKYTKHKFPEFKKFSSIERLSRDCIVTEKLDGTNGLIYIDKNNNIYAGSRNKWLWSSFQNEIKNDNHGFAKWVKENKEDLLSLGYGYHYGEFIGEKIQRGYNLKEKKYYLFDIKKWNVVNKPKCCEVVPVLYKGIFDTNIIQNILTKLEIDGSVAIPGYKNPEGIVILHIPSRTLFKKTIKNDEKGKTNAEIL